MEASFLLSDVPVGHGHQLIRSITHNNYSVIAFVANFENVANLTIEFPGVTWIVLDINRNSDTVLKFLKVLPIPNYIVNFSCANFARCALDVIQSKGISFKERERGHSEMTLEGIADDDDEEECIIVNVVEKRSELKKKSKSISKRVGRIVKGAKKKISSLTQDDDGSSEENAPLLDRRASEEVSQNIFLSIFSLCCPCFSTEPEPEYCFRNTQELRLQMDLEQLAEIHKVFKKIHESSMTKWDITLLELRRKESQKIEELASKIDDMRQQEEQELSSLKDKQNTNTRDRLSNVLSAETIRRIEESRSRQTKGTVKYDADRAFREGQSLITKQVAIDKAQIRERHYFKLVEEQLQKLTEIQLKYQKKTRVLQERFFKTRT